MSSEDVGYLLGALVIPGLLVWWGIHLRNRPDNQSKIWIVPTALGVLFLLASIPGLIGRFGGNALPVREVPVDSAFVPIEGFEFIPDPSTEAAARKQFQEQVGIAFDDVAVRTVERSADRVGSVFAVTVDPDAVASITAEDITTGIATAAKAKAVPDSIAGQSVWTTSSENPPLTFVVWQRSGSNLFVIVSAPDPSTARELASAMLVAVDASP